MLRSLLYISCLFFGLNSVHGQSLPAFIEAMEEAFAEKDYYNAYYYAETALEFDTNKVDLLYNHADAARLLDAYTVAEKSYQKVVDKDNNASYPLATLYLAEMQQKLGKYDQAQTNYELYLAEASGDDEQLMLRAQKELKSIEWAKQMLADDDSKTEIIKLDEYNSPYSDFGAIKHEEQIYFSSLRYSDDLGETNPKKLISKVLQNNSILESENELSKSGLHTAHTAFNQAGDKMFYTLCQYENSYDIRCDIFYRSVGEDGSFGEPIEVPINVEGFTTTQPHIAFDPYFETEVLYFASDRPSGKGKLDIWYSVIREGEFLDPVNLIAINTPENDITPFYHEASKKFYFSSEGYQSLGGYDIFEAEKSYDYFTVPKNKGIPVNTSFNDVYFVLNEKGDTAMFSSNRLGSMYLEDSFEACCYDIYQAHMDDCVIKLNVLTFIDGGAELNDATVTIVNAATGEVVDSHTNVDKNKYEIDLDCDKEYKIITDRDGFEPDTILLSTAELDPNSTVTKRVFLKPDGTYDGELLSLDLNVFDQQTLEALEGATVTVECEGDISSKQTLNNTDQNDFHFQLKRGCRNKVVISRSGYQTQTIYIDTTDPTVGPVITKDIYMIKGGNSDDLSLYLPVVVYYDNDDPDKRSYKLYSETNYTEVYYPYIAKKETFKNKFSADQSGDMKYLAENRVEDFFEQEVKQGYDRLQLFTSKLLESLRAGNTLQLTIKGYASPRASSKYNLALAQRRISNIINELNDYGSGVLSPFINNGQLVIRQISYGEELSNGKVSDSYPNRKQSVYSPDASRERKVELISIDKINE